MRLIDLFLELTNPMKTESVETVMNKLYPNYKIKYK